MLEFGTWNLGFVKLVLQKSTMQYFKNALLLATFTLLGLGLEAAAPLHSFPSVQTAINAPQGDGVVEVIQGRHSVGVDVLVPGSVRLIVKNSNQEIIFRKLVTPQIRHIDINTTLYAAGEYTLEAISSVDTEVVSFVIRGEE